ncbi:restriction endonuclease subunit S [Vagococcus fluvialis]|uniref:restriction endonuclease subunit S n=1 Tax=Vagococcus fluvialis TaxID=2738 RepID=UPI003B591D17
MLAWEQRKLGSVGKTQSGVGFPDSEQGGNEGIPFFKVSDMNNKGNENEMVTANNYVSEEQVKRKKWKPLETVPAVIFAKVGAAIMLNRKRIIRSPFLFDNNTMAYIFDDSWNVEFGKTLFETINLPKYAQIGALPSYNSSDIESIEVTVPDKIEQIKIGYLFKQLDKTIALHERELELLNLTKKGFLQQIFPGNKQKYPNIRFENFDEEWEQCELIELAEFNPKSKLPKEFEYVDLESVVGTSLIDHRTETINSAPSRAQRLAEFGDLFYQTVRPYQKNNYLYELPYNNYVFSTGYAQMRPKYNSYFLLTLVQEEKFVSRVLERSTGTSYPSINSNDLSKLKVRVPKKEEQTKIGNFFKQLDETINIQERKLNKLKKTKKSFLQKMFI